MGEWLPDGARVIVDPEEELSVPHLCWIVIRQGDGPWARFMTDVGCEFAGACKLFLGWLSGPTGDLCLIGQLAPPVVGLIPETEIEALHRVIGVDGNPVHMSANDSAAYALIAPFRREGSLKPINPAWRAN